MTQEATKVENAQGAQRPKTISLTATDIEALSNPKLNSIIRRVMEQSDNGTTGKTIILVAKTLLAQEDKK